VEEMRALSEGFGRGEERKSKSFLGYQSLKNEEGSASIYST